MPNAHDPRLVEWLRDCGLNPDMVYRVDIRMDGMTVYEYRPTPKGIKVYDPKTGSARVREPYELKFKDYA